MPAMPYPFQAPASHLRIPQATDSCPPSSVFPPPQISSYFHTAVEAPFHLQTASTSAPEESLLHFPIPACSQIQFLPVRFGVQWHRHTPPSYQAAPVQGHAGNFSRNHSCQNYMHLLKQTPVHPLYIPCVHLSGDNRWELPHNWISDPIPDSRIISAPSHVRIQRTLSAAYPYKGHTPLPSPAYTPPRKVPHNGIPYR